MRLTNQNIATTATTELSITKHKQQTEILNGSQEILSSINDRHMGTIIYEISAFPFKKIRIYIRIFKIFLIVLMCMKTYKTIQSNTHDDIQLALIVYFSS